MSDDAGSPHRSSLSDFSSAIPTPTDSCHGGRKRGGGELEREEQTRNSITRGNPKTRQEEEEKGRKDDEGKRRRRGNRRSSVGLERSGARSQGSAMGEEAEGARRTRPEFWVPRPLSWCLNYCWICSC